MRKFPHVFGPGIVALLLLVSCGDDDDGATNGGANDAAATNTPAEGSGPGQGGTADVGDFPIPLPDGEISVLLSTSSDRVVNYQTEDFDGLLTFYENWIAGQSDTYERFEFPNGTVTWENPAGTRLITVTPEFDGPDGPVAQVTVSAIP